MFKVGGGQSIGGDDGPLVFEDAHLGLAHVDHRFDSQRHARPEDRSGAALAEIWNLGFLVKTLPDPVADKFPDHRITVSDRLLFHVGADVAEAPVGLDQPDRRYPEFAPSPSDRRSVSGSMIPTGTLIAVSPIQPSRTMPTSIFTTSP